MRALSVLIICGLATLKVAANGAPADKTPLPDVYLVSIDTLRADHVHCYGY